MQHTEGLIPDGPMIRVHGTEGIVEALRPSTRRSWRQSWPRYSRPRAIMVAILPPWSL
jgi:hypothetical protein